jgi:hypothetical protein
MRTWNFGKYHSAAVFFRLCLVTIVALSLAMGGMALNPKPAQAIFDIDPALWNSPPLQECVPFVGPTFTATCCTCSDPANNVFFWLVDTGAGIPTWVNLDPVTGVLSGCPPLDASTDPLNPFTFGVVCTELCVCPNLAHTTCNLIDCTPAGDNQPPCVTVSPTIATVTLNVVANVPPCVTAINPTFYPVAWEGIPFFMTLTATGGVGPLNWSAIGLPAGLSVTDAANGIISGTPLLGTCGIYNVTATVTDTGTCPSCCPDISRPFILIVDCWANYTSIFYYSTACDFKVEVGSGLTQGQTNVWVDGSYKTTLAGGQSEDFISVPCESHLVMVDQTVLVPSSNTRFSVVGSNTKMVTDTDNYAYFNYAQEVYIQTATDPAVATQPPGTGFYTVGSNFISTAPGTVDIDIQNGIKYVFKEWKLPDGTTRPTRDLVFTVNQGGSVTAAYDTYYLLTLKSDYPPIDERTFELAGSTATWNLSLHAVPVESGFWRFMGVTQTPVNPSGQHLMTGPATVEITWRPNYLPAIIAILIVLLVIVGLIFLIRWLRSRPAAKPARRVARKAPSRAKKPAAKKRATRTRKRKSR